MVKETVAKEPKKDLTVSSQASSALATPMEERLGFEEDTAQEDIILPRAALLQSKSPEVEEPEYQNKYRPGQIINSLTKDVLPEIFIPIFKFTNWVKFNPRDPKAEGFDPQYEPGKMIWKLDDSTDARTKEAEFGPNGEKPTAIKFLNFFAYFPGYPMPVIISFGKTSYKTGKQLISLAQFSGGHMFSRKYKLFQKLEKNDKGTFFKFMVMPMGFTEGEDLKVAGNLHSQFRGKKIDVHQEDPEAEAQETQE